MMQQDDLAPIEDDVTTLIESLRQRYTQADVAADPDAMRLGPLQAEVLAKAPDAIELDSADREALRLALEGKDVLLVKKNDPGAACATAFLACLENAIYIDCATWPNMPRSSGAETRLFIYDFGAQTESETKKLKDFIARKREQGLIVFISAAQQRLMEANFADADNHAMFFGGFFSVMEER